ncbi:carbon-nitrogen hydrolase family protein [Aquicella lusitana]|uniref:Nitrilase n=1 Tax=Aquicella lusitana TaxID=254246 RepID=A0A370GQT7_9COXI|nr:carbon-nitrogen hydrolase family protein [Aquicella lusitana]RDI46047.1 nitrilase [Aquicella lusitana]VVC73356.1 Hydrolase [Aquicella lusitana]
MTSEKRKNKLPKIAAIQMCSSPEVDENLENANRLIREAVAQGAELIVLPENFAYMGMQDDDRLIHKETFGEGKIQQFLATIAKEKQIWIVGGTIPIAGQHPNKVRAACLLYNDKGSVIARYDKVHLFDAVISNKECYQESKIVEPGHDVVVVDTPFGKLGLAVCFDVRFPALFMQMARQGVEIIALPSAFTVPTGEAHWKILTRARAIDTFSYLIAAGQGGEHANGRKTYGHSLIADPWGRLLAEQTNTGSGVVHAEMDLNWVAQCRKSIPLIR